MKAGQSDGSVTPIDYEDDDADSIEYIVAEDEAGGDKDQENSNDHRLATKETVLVNRSKIAVILVVLIAAAATGTATYLFMEEEEEVWYKDEFEEFSEEIFETSELQYYQSDLALKLLADDFTSLETTVGGPAIPSHPNVTHNNFAVKADKVQQLVGGGLIGFAPLVNSWEKASWEEYAINNQAWIKQDLEMAGVTEYPGEIPNTIHSHEEHEQGTGDEDDEVPLHFPIWQIYPTPLDAAVSPLMVDLTSIPSVRETIREVITKRHAAVTPVQDLKFLLHYDSATPFADLGNDSEDMMHTAEDSHDEDHHEEEEDHSPAMSLFIEPVFASFNENGPVIGIVFSVVDWQVFFSGILEDEADGVVIDLENTCDSSRFSFLVTNDEDVEFLGADFVHNTNYASMSDRSAINGSGEDSSSDSSDRRRFLQESIEDSEDSEDEHESTECGFYVSTHATVRFEENWERNTTVLYTVVVVSIFLFTGMIFLVYDWLVQRRQDKVMDTAEKTTAIVSSLFPKEVRDRMMAEQEATSKRMRSYAFHEETHKETIDSAPIADLFDETSCFFGDLVGFTNWAASRDPSQVFRLLECIYGRFDQLAEERRVFKVETIGDCYVAVCGLPEPNKNHAVVMARFANDCLTALETSTRKLVDELGPDTADLRIRIGLHSGPVTAGVLRGRRARFQLFGDSVNTTSRMESTGSPDKIHVSQAFADNLIKAGKSHWLHRREKKVFAKGLGEITSYWLQVRTSKASSTASCESTSSVYSGTHIIRPVGYVAEEPHNTWDPSDMSDIRSRLHSRFGDKRLSMMLPPSQQLEKMEELDG